MRELKVCFVGIGSIAKRHIRNLCKVCEERKITVTVDALRRKHSAQALEVFPYIHEIYTEVKDVPEDYDIIFLTNPTEFHLDMLKQLHTHGKNFFIEKPLTSIRKLSEVFQIAYREDAVYYVAAPLRYTKVIQYLKEHVDKSEVIGVRSISSSYLPEWRADVDYRNTYSADKDLGGGVSIDLIHEWDYLKYLFGMPGKVFYTCGKKSDLEINCEDYAVYVGEYPNMFLELHLDYFGRQTLREVMIFTKEETLIGDLAHSQVTFLKQGKTLSFMEERDDYQKRELEHFLDIVQGKAVCDNGIKDAYQTLKLTQGEVL